MAPNSKRAKKTIFTRLLSTTMFSVNGKKESRGRSLPEPYLCGKQNLPLISERHYSTPQCPTSTVRAVSEPDLSKIVIYKIVINELF